MKKSSRIFTIEEVDTLLPRLDTILGRFASKKEDHERMHDQILMHELLTQAGTRHDETQSHEWAQELERSVAALEKDIEEMMSLGCILRSIEQGWVDFLAQKDGAFVYLCWKKGEKSIQYYHSAESIHTGRLPL